MTKKYMVLKPYVYKNSHAQRGAIVELSEEEVAFLQPGGFVEPLNNSGTNSLNQEQEKAQNPKKSSKP